jgi:hypothetical protein
MSCGVLYIIGKLLERRCLKWARIAHLDIWNTSYGQKKGRESNCQFDSRPQKVKNQPDLLNRRGRATYCWKDLDESYNFSLDRIAIRGLLAKLWGSKVAGVRFGAISGLPFESPGKKSHLDVASVESCKVYYKGESDGFPQVQAVVSFMCPRCPWFVLAPRVLQLCTNHFVWVMCRPVWVSEAYQLFLVPSRSSNTPLYPSKCCELGSVLRLLLLPLLLGLTFESFKELGVHHLVSELWENVDHDSWASLAEFPEGDITNICGFKIDPSEHIGGFKDIIKNVIENVCVHAAKTLALKS